MIDVCLLSRQNELDSSRPLGAAIYYTVAETRGEKSAHVSRRPDGVNGMELSRFADSECKTEINVIFRSRVEYASQHV